MGETKSGQQKFVTALHSCFLSVTGGSSMQSNGDGLLAPVIWSSAISLNTAQGLTLLFWCCSARLIQVRCSLQETVELSKNFLLSLKFHEK
jgi:hypothetical protein